MRFPTFLWLPVLVAGPISAHASDLASDPSGLWKSFPAIYKIHSGIVSDGTPATANDRMLTVQVNGKPAQEIFNSIGPDAPEGCSGAKGDRERAKKGVLCTYTAQPGNPKNSHYRCWVGINLQTGDGDVRVSC